MDDVICRAASNCAGMYRVWAERTGHVSALWPDLSVADFGLPSSQPIDSACVLTPPESAARWADLVDRAEAVFARQEGGPIQIWSAWPTPDLTDRGYTRYAVPALICDVDVIPRPSPPELQLVTVRTAADRAAAAELIDSVFGCHAPNPAALISPALLDEDVEIFLGRVDGRPVATATAYVSDGFCGVYAVAVSADARGRGYGEAVTWAATTFRSDLPAALQASPLGLPVYLRMGYQVVGEFALWEGPRR